MGLFPKSLKRAKLLLKSRQTWLQVCQTSYSPIPNKLQSNIFKFQSMIYPTSHQSSLWKCSYQRLYKYFSVNNLSSSSQFGFRSGEVQTPNEHAIFKFSDDILKLLDQKKVVIATFMDISKAFDCVPHNISVSELKRYVIHATAQYFFYCTSMTCIDPQTRCALFILPTIQQFLHPTVTSTMFMPQWTGNW